MRKTLSIFLAAAMMLGSTGLSVLAADAPFAVQSDETYERSPWTKNGNTYTSPYEDLGKSFSVYKLGESDTVTISATLEVGMEHGFLFGVQDMNGDNCIDETGDQYYLVDLQSSGKVGIERNDTDWGQWAETSSETLFGTVNLTVIFQNGRIVVLNDQEVIASYQDADPLPGTGFALCAKRCDATFRDVTFDYTAQDVEVPTIGEGSLSEGENGGNWTVDEGVYTCTDRMSWPNFGVYGLGNTSDVITVSATVTLGDLWTERSQHDMDGGDSGILFAVSDQNGNHQIEEGADFYYLVDISNTDEGPLVGVEKNAGGWGNWAVRAYLPGNVAPFDHSVGETVTLTASYNPKTATIHVWINGYPTLEYIDGGSPLGGTGYGLASKITGGVMSNISCTNEDKEWVAPYPTDDLDWNFDESSGVLTISGNGAMADYQSPNVYYRDFDTPWAEYNSQITSVVIKEGVTHIGNAAFKQCLELQSIELPNSLESIGSNAFAACVSLDEIEIPDSVVSIGEYAFCYCYGLTNIVLPEGVTEIKTHTFEGCSNLVSIELPGVTAIGSDAFYSCTSLADINLPTGLTRISDYTFYKCTSLAKITIPDGVTEIAEYAFISCSNLTEVDLPDSLTYIGNSAFYDCLNLNKIDLPDSLTYIGEYAFYYCISLSEIDLPASVTYIGYGAFLSCSNLKTVYVASPNVLGSDLNATYLLDYADTIYILSSITQIPERIVEEFPHTSTIMHNGTAYTSYSKFPPNVITTDGVDAWASIRKNGGTFDMRFVLATNGMANPGDTVTITFETETGKKVLTRTISEEPGNNLMSLYDTVWAAGVEYTAQDCRIFGCVVTNIPLEAFTSVSITVSSDVDAVLLEGTLPYNALGL